MTESLEQTRQAVLDPLPAPSNGNADSAPSALPEQARVRRYRRALALTLLGAAVLLDRSGCWCVTRRARIIRCG